MVYMFNDIQYIGNDKIYFKNELQGCYVENYNLHIYNENIHYVYENNAWYTFSEEVFYPCGVGAHPMLELNVDKDVIEELLYIEPIENEEIDKNSEN